MVMPKYHKCYVCKLWEKCCDPSKAQEPASKIHCIYDYMIQEEQ